MTVESETANPTADPHGENEPIVLTGEDLTVDRVVQVARAGAKVTVGADALNRVREARRVVEQVLAQGAPVYGVNTGLGSLSRHRIAPEDLEQFSFATVADQTATYGRPLRTDVVRAMMLARANGMAKAGVGVRRELLLQLVELLDRGVHPVVRDVGSVGQADLSEMSDIGKVLIGRGRAEVGGQILPGAEALARAGMTPLTLAPKEALALISSNGVTVGHGSLVLADAADLVDGFQIAGARSLEGYAGNLSPIHPVSTRLRPHLGQIAAARRLRELLEGSRLWRPGAARHLQDPLSFRCIPQAHGALYDVMSYARGTMEIELNSAGDNPMVATEDETIVSVGNFDVVSLAMAFDLLRLGLAQVASVANERVQKLLWREFSGLPTGLADHDGATGGLRPLGRWMAARAAEARFLANPASLDYRGQLAEGIEDHASMAPLSVRKTSELVSVCHRMVALELIVAAQAVDLGERAPLGRGTRHAYDTVRECVPRLVDETEWAADIDRLVDLVAEGELTDRVATDAGEREPLSEYDAPGLATGARAPDPTSRRGP